MSKVQRYKDSITQEQRTIEVYLCPPIAQTKLYCYLPEQVRILLKLYKEEKYLLVVSRIRTEFEVFVSFKVWKMGIATNCIFIKSIKLEFSQEGATSLSVLRSVWQSYWLHQNSNESDDVFSQLEQSLIELKDKFDDFLLQLEKSGWETNQLYLKVPKEISIQEQSTT